VYQSINPHNIITAHIAADEKYKVCYKIVNRCQSWEKRRWQILDFAIQLLAYVKKIWSSELQALVLSHMYFIYILTGLLSQPGWNSYRVVSFTKEIPVHLLLGA
jgi:hypothetical protein